MEVSGRIGPLDTFISCQPCQNDGDTVKANGYCKNCDQFICLSCIKAHLKFPVTKNHVIKYKDEMPTCMSAQSDPCTELCDVHKNEIVKYYCKEHNSVGCGDCMVLEHKPCKVQLVSDVSCNYDDSDELVLIKHRIDHLKKNLESFKTETKLSLKTVDEIKTSVIKEIKQFRKEIDTYLDKVTKNLIQEVETLSAIDVSRQQKLQGQCKTMTEDIEKMQRKLKQCKDNVNDLFVSSNKVRNTLQKCHEMNEELSGKSQIKMLKFLPTEKLNVLKAQNICLGNLEIELQNFPGQCDKSVLDKNTHFVKKFNLKGKQDGKCDIGGMTMISEDEILCTDALNKSLNVLNLKEGKITSKIKMPCQPIDVTTIDSSSAATTLYEEGRIVFLNTLNGLHMSHSIKILEKCFGIDHRNGIIVVTYVEPPAVQVIDMEGNILQEVKGKMLQDPRYVCLSNDMASMFVTDRGKNAVYEFSLQGHCKNTIKRDEIKSPVGITVTNCGSVVVCDPDRKDKVGIIVPGTRKIIPLYLQNIQAPWYIHICEEQRKMFISEFYTAEDGNFIKMFDLK